MLLLQRIVIIALLFQLSCSAPKQKDTRFTAEFKAPQFDDSDRKKMLEETFPVIDSMFRNYAAKNHFPALVWYCRRRRANSCRCIRFCQPENKYVGDNKITVQDCVDDEKFYRYGDLKIEG